MPCRVALLLLLLPLAAACPTEGAESAEDAVAGVACIVLGMAVRYVTRDGQRRLLCPRAGCGRTYESRGGLRTHLHDHDGVACAQEGCGRAFETRKGLQRHVEAHHRGVRVPCEIEGCDRSFTSRSHMNEHVEAHHSGVRVPCEVEGCDRSFAWRVNMKEHVEAHHRGVRFPCAHCGKSFATKRYMRAHVRRVHPNAGAGAGGEAAAGASARGPAVSPVSPAARAEPTLPDLKPELNHPDATIPCPKAREGCPRVFRTKEEVRQHVAHPAMHIFGAGAPCTPAAARRR